jgi:hypothetical protein
MNLAVEWITGKRPQYNCNSFRNVVHPAQAQILQDYMKEEDSLPATTASRILTAAPLRDDRTISDLWRLLPFALYSVEKEPERKKLIVLISLMQKESGVEGTEFQTLNVLFNYCRRDRLIMERTVQHVVSENPSYRTLVKWRESWKKQGNIEALMLHRGVRRRTTLVRWGVEALDRMVTSRHTAALEIYIGAVHAWLETARHELYKGLASEDPSQIPEATYFMRWDACEEALLQLSTRPSNLSDEGKRLAWECYKWMMKKQ